MVGDILAAGIGRCGDRIPVRTRFFRTHPDRLWGQPSLLYNVYRVRFPGVKRPGRDVHSSPSSAEVKERVEIYLQSSSGPSWPVLWQQLSLPFKSLQIVEVYVTTTEFVVSENYRRKNVREPLKRVLLVLTQLCYNKQKLVLIRLLHVST